MDFTAKYIEKLKLTADTEHEAQRHNSSNTDRLGWKVLLVIPKSNVMYILLYNNVFLAVFYE